MITLVSVFGIVVTLLLTSMGYGRRCCKDSSLSIQILIGFAILLGLIEVVDLILFPFVSTKTLMYLCYTVILGTGLFLGITSGIKGLKPDWKKLSFFLIYLVVMIVIMANRTIGEPTFDSVFYLSYVSEWSNTLAIETMTYETGVLTSKIASLYDFQAFYHLNAFFLWIIQSVNYMLTGIKILVGQIYVWSTMIFFYILFFCFQDAVVQELDFKNKWFKAAVTVFLLGIIGNFYWNNALSFFGNSYRQFYSAVFSLFIYHLFKSKTLTYGSAFTLAMISSAMLAMSSTALFLNFIVLFALIFVLLSSEVEHLGRKILILVMPTVLFGLNYITASNRMVVLLCCLAVLFFVFCLVYDLVFSDEIRQVVLKVLQKMMLFVPVFIAVVSLTIWLKGKSDIWMFFRSHSVQDMVWDLFTFRDVLHFCLNGIYLLGAVHLIRRKVKSAYLKYLIYMLLLFINPVNVVVLKQYLSGNVFYRAYEVVFNYFTYSLLLVECLSLLEKKKIWVKLICCMLCGLSLMQAVTVYHAIFKADDQFDKLYKVEKEELDVLLYLNNYLANVDERVTVVSQMDSLKTFTPQISLAYSLRAFDKYTLNASADELMKIFYPRDHAGQILFEEEPDFTCACDRLIEREIDFVVLDKMQVYVAETGYESLYYLVRDCADLLYENERYALFRFYW